MTGKPSSKAETDADSGSNCADIRTSRSIRFSDSEWEKIETAAADRKDTASEFVREAALARAVLDCGTAGAALPAGLVELIEATYRGVYLLATLKRDRLGRRGRGDEVDSVLQDARISQAQVISRA